MQKEDITVNNTEKLVDYVKSLTPEQVDKIINRLPLLQQMLNLTDNQAIYTQTFTDLAFGTKEKMRI